MLKGATMRGRTRRKGTAGAGLADPSAHYRFVAPQRSRPVVIGALLAGVILTLLAVRTAAATDSPIWIVLTAVGALCCVGLMTILQTRLPQVVTIDRSIIEIRKSGRTERFDLVDPTVEVLGRDGEIAFRCYDGRFAVVQARDVDWQVFTDVVMHYQNHADRKATERSDRFNH